MNTDMTALARFLWVADTIRKNTGSAPASVTIDQDWADELHAELSAGLDFPYTPKAWRRAILADQVVIQGIKVEGSWAVQQGGARFYAKGPDGSKAFIGESRGPIRIAPLM